MARDQTELLEMGARLTELRKSLGLKQQYIADYCGVTLRTYQFWQQGKHPPEQESLEKLAELFGVTTKYILRGETPQLHADGDFGEQLDRIEAKLDQLIDKDEHLTQQDRELLRRWEELAQRVGMDIGKGRPLSRSVPENRVASQ